MTAITHTTESGPTEKLVRDSQMAAILGAIREAADTAVSAALDFPDENQQESKKQAALLYLAASLLDPNAESIRILSPEDVDFWIAECIADVFGEVASDAR